MATTGPFHGKLLTLYLNGTAIAYSQDLSVSITRDEVDITSKDSAYMYGMLPGNMKVAISGNGLHTVASGTSKTLIDALKAGTSFAWKVSTNVSADYYLSGASCYVVSTEISASMTDASKLSFSITVNGSFSLTAKT